MTELVRALYFKHLGITHIGVEFPGVRPSGSVFWGVLYVDEETHAQIKALEDRAKEGK